MGRRSRVAVRLDRNAAHVHFDDATHGALADFAEQHALTRVASIRLLVERALAADAMGPVGSREEASFRQQLNALGVSALACLIAVEQNQRLLISMLPEGEERAEELWEAAASSARNRLIRVDRALAEESE